MITCSLRERNLVNLVDFPPAAVLVTICVSIITRFTRFLPGGLGGRPTSALSVADGEGVFEVGEVGGVAGEGDGDDVETDGLVALLEAHVGVG